MASRSTTGLVAATFAMLAGCSGDGSGAGADTAFSPSPDTPDAAVEPDAVSPSAASWGGGAGGPPANIVIIVADDLGYGDVSGLCDLTGCPRPIATPHIDRLAAEGMWLTNAYTTAATCSPSRAGFNTGQYQQRQGFEFNTRDFRTAVEEGRGLLADTELLSERLKGAGYATALVGKWHMGITSSPTTLPAGGRFDLDAIDMDLHPIRQGFDSAYGFLEGAHDYWPPDQGGGTSFIMRGLEREPHTSYLTDAFADEAVAFIEARDGAPFFLYAPFSAPHKPLQADPAIEAQLMDIPNDNRRAYVALVISLDNAVGRILDALDGAGVAEDTLVIFFSDNGALVDRFASNHPLRLGKASLFEGGIRVPFAVRYPRYLAPGLVCDAAVSTLDIVPSALDAAGIAFDDQDLAGRNLAQLAETDCKVAPPPRDLHWRAGPNRAIRRGAHKLIQATNTSSGASRSWLFDLDADIGEQSDLSAAEPELVRTLEQALDAWEATLNPPRWPAWQAGEVSVDGFVYEYHL